MSFILVYLVPIWFNFLTKEKLEIYIIYNTVIILTLGALLQVRSKPIHGNFKNKTYSWILNKIFEISIVEYVYIWDYLRLWTLNFIIFFKGNIDPIIYWNRSLLHYLLMFTFIKLDQAGSSKRFLYSLLHMKFVWAHLSKLNIPPIKFIFLKSRWALLKESGLYFHYWRNWIFIFLNPLESLGK